MSVALMTIEQPPVWTRLMAELFRREPRFAGAALCLLALMLPTLFALSLDQRTLLDVNVWVKPLKFEAALIVYLGTLAWFAGWLPDKVRTARWYAVFSTAVILAVTAEMTWIVGAAASGVLSHFNTDSAFMITVYAVMGVLAVLLTSATLIYGIAFLRDRNSALAPGVRWSLGLGLILTFILTVTVAGTMSSNGSHFVGGNMSDAEAWPIMGWARDGGDLRVAHFFATHAMHVVPLLGFLVTPLLSMRAGRVAVVAFSGLYAAFVLFAFIEALSGRPFLSSLL